MKEVFATIGVIVLIILAFVGITWGFLVLEDNLGYRECRQQYGQDFKYDAASNLCVAPNGDVKAAE